jgi:hypothetical protein
MRRNITVTLYSVGAVMGIGGGFAAMIGGLAGRMQQGGALMFAQVPAPNGGELVTGGAMVAITGIGMILSTLAGKWADDRKDARQAQLKALQIRSRVNENTANIRAILVWIERAAKANPQLPHPPELVVPESPDTGDTADIKALDP